MEVGDKKNKVWYTRKIDKIWSSIFKLHFVQDIKSGRGSRLTIDG
jgi:hypothetical protein